MPWVRFREKNVQVNADNERLLSTTAGRGDTVKATLRSDREDDISSSLLDI